MARLSWANPPSDPTRPSGSRLSLSLSTPAVIVRRILAQFPDEARSSAEADDNWDNVGSSPSTSRSKLSFAPEAKVNGRWGSDGAQSVPTGNGRRAAAGPSGRRDSIGSSEDGYKPANHKRRRTMGEPSAWAVQEPFVYEGSNSPPPSAADAHEPSVPMPAVGDLFASRLAFEEAVKAALCSLGYSGYVKSSPKLDLPRPRLLMSCSRKLMCTWTIEARRRPLTEKEVESFAEGQYEQVGSTRYLWQVADVAKEHSHGPQLSASSKVTSSPVSAHNPAAAAPLARVDTAKRRTRSSKPPAELQAELARAFPEGEGKTVLMSAEPVLDQATLELAAKFANTARAPVSDRRDGGSGSPVLGAERQLSPLATPALVAVAKSMSPPAQSRLPLAPRQASPATPFEEKKRMSFELGE